MKSVVLCFAVFLIGIPSLLADEVAPRFPKVGVEYSFSTPNDKGLGSEGGAPPFYGFAREILIREWLGGTWFRIAYPANGGTDDAPKIEIRETNLNIAQLLTLTPTAEEKCWIAKRLSSK